MYSELYRPKNLDELSFNNNLTKKLKNISLQNFIIYGNHGSGKMSRVYCHFAKIFNESVYQTWFFLTHLLFLHPSTVNHNRFHPLQLGRHPNFLKGFSPLLIEKRIIVKQTYLLEFRIMEIPY